MSMILTVSKFMKQGVEELTTQEIHDCREYYLGVLPNSTKSSREGVKNQLAILEEELNKRDLGTSSEPEEVKIEVTELSLLKELVETNKKISSWVTFMGAVVLIQIIIGVIVGFILMP